MNLIGFKSLRFKNVSLNNSAMINQEINLGI